MIERLESLKRELDSIKKTGDLVDSVKTYEEILNILAKEKDTSLVYRNEYIEVANDYSGVLRYLGYYDKSEEFLLETISLLKANYEGQEKNYGTTLNNLGNLYRLRGDLEKALSTYEQVEQEYKKTQGIGPILWSALWNNKGLVLLQSGYSKKSYELFKKSEEILSAAGKDKGILYATTLNNLVEPCERLGKHDEKKKYMSEAMNILKDIDSNEKRPLMAALFNSMGIDKYRNGEYDDSIKLLEENVSLIKEIYGENSPYYDNALNNLGFVKKEYEEVKGK